MIDIDVMELNADKNKQTNKKSQSLLVEVEKFPLVSNRGEKAEKHFCIILF